MEKKKSIESVLDKAGQVKLEFWMEEELDSLKENTGLAKVNIITDAIKDEIVRYKKDFLGFKRDHIHPRYQIYLTVLENKLVSEIINRVQETEMDKPVALRAQITRSSFVRIAVKRKIDKMKSEAKKQGSKHAG